MANITVTTSGNSINVDFGVYVSSPTIVNRKGSYDKRNLGEIGLEINDLYIQVEMNGRGTKSSWILTWDQSYTGEDMFIIDSIDGVSPISQEDLYNKLIALRG